MDSDSSAIAGFLKGWVAELRRAIQMFSGEEPKVTCAQADTPSVGDSATTLWASQSFEGPAVFHTWIGAEEPTWMQLGQMLGTGTVETIQSTYTEIVNQAQQGSATLASVGRSIPVRCQELHSGVQPDFDLAHVFCWEITIEGMEVPPLCFLVERNAVVVLSSEASAESSRQHSVRPGGKHSQNFEAFCNLMLPVSVSMVEAELELKHILNAGSKSLITVNKNHGEPVDLLVYDTVIARGKVVLVDGNYGFQVDEIVSEEERLTLLQ